MSIKSVSLQSLFLEFSVPRRFDLLSIDVEGSDFDVLKSFDLEDFRPKLIVIEMHEFRLKDRSATGVYDYLLSRDYELRALTKLNGVFVDSR
jgi:hypothetical protein